MYSFPRAAVTNYQKLGGLKQWKFIVSHFWTLEIPNPGVLARLLSSGGSVGESVLSPSLWHESAMPGIPWLVAAPFQSLPLSSHGVLHSTSLFSLL